MMTEKENLILTVISPVSTKVADIKKSDKVRCGSGHVLVIQISTFYLFILVGSLDGLWRKSLLDEDPNSLKKKKSHKET